MSKPVNNNNNNNNKSPCSHTALVKGSNVRKQRS